MDPAVRLLRLLSVLQTRSQWEGEDLARRLEVTSRTLRRDIARLRDLGYPVDAVPGRGGGYRLGAGGRLPPLLMDDEEAVAIAVGLRAAATSTVSGVEESAASALAKLDQVLPAGLRDRVASIAASTVELPKGDLPQVDPDVLAVLAAACRRGEGLTFGYRTHHGHLSRRSVEPLRIVHTGRRWYLVARDRDATQDDGWRTFRIDRISEPAPTGRRHTFEDPPDPVALVAEATGIAPWDIEARFLLYADAATVARHIPPGVGVVEPADDGTCILRIAASEIAPLIDYAARIPYDFDVLGPDAVREALHAQAVRLIHATTGQ
jgi:predicted DNA-binding transcriptional regulator YafY